MYFITQGEMIELHRASRRGRDKPVLISIGLFTWFSHHNFRTQHFYQNRKFFKNKVSVVLNCWYRFLAVLLSVVAEKLGNRQTDRQTDGMTNQVP